MAEYRPGPATAPENHVHYENCIMQAVVGQAVAVVAAVSFHRAAAHFGC